METRNVSRATSSGPWWDPLMAVVVLALLSAGAVRFVYQHGYILYYGDAAAHLNIARRVADSRTPGLDQLGTVWLPLPHLLMAPLAGDNRLWRTGIAGAIPSAGCFVLAGGFLVPAGETGILNPRASTAS